MSATMSQISDTVVSVSDNKQYLFEVIKTIAKLRYRYAVGEPVSEAARYEVAYALLCQASKVFKRLTLRRLTSNPRACSSSFIILSNYDGKGSKRRIMVCSETALSNLHNELNRLLKISSKTIVQQQQQNQEQVVTIMQDYQIDLLAMILVVVNRLAVAKDLVRGKHFFVVNKGASIAKLINQAIGHTARLLADAVKSGQVQRARGSINSQQQLEVYRDQQQSLLNLMYELHARARHPYTHTRQPDVSRQQAIAGKEVVLDAWEQSLASQELLAIAKTCYRDTALTVKRDKNLSAQAVVTQLLSSLGAALDNLVTLEQLIEVKYVEMGVTEASLADHLDLKAPQEATEPTHLTDLTDSIDSIDSIESIESIELTELKEPTELIQATEFTEFRKFTELTSPTTARAEQSCKQGINAVLQRSMIVQLHQMQGYLRDTRQLLQQVLQQLTSYQTIDKLCQTGYVSLEALQRHLARLQSNSDNIAPAGPYGVHLSLAVVNLLLTLLHQQGDFLQQQLQLLCQDPAQLSVVEQMELLASYSDAEYQQALASILQFRAVQQQLCQQQSSRHRSNPNPNFNSNLPPNSNLTPNSNQRYSCSCRPSHSLGVSQNQILQPQQQLVTQLLTGVPLAVASLTAQALVNTNDHAFAYGYANAPTPATQRQHETSLQPTNTTAAPYSKLKARWLLAGDQSFHSLTLLGFNNLMNCLGRAVPGQQSNFFENAFRDQRDMVTSANSVSRALATVLAPGFSGVVATTGSHQLPNGLSKPVSKPSSDELINASLQSHRRKLAYFNYQIPSVSLDMEIFTTLLGACTRQQTTTTTAKSASLELPQEAEWFGVAFDKVSYYQGLIKHLVANLINNSTASQSYRLPKRVSLLRNFNRLPSYLAQICRHLDLQFKFDNNCIDAREVVTLITRLTFRVWQEYSLQLDQLLSQLELLNQIDLQVYLEQLELGSVVLPAGSIPRSLATARVELACDAQIVKRLAITATESFRLTPDAVTIATSDLTYRNYLQELSFEQLVAVAFVTSLELETAAWLEWYQIYGYYVLQQFVASNLVRYSSRKA